MENISDIKLSVDFRDKNGNIVSPNLVPFDLIIKSTYRATLKTASFDGATFTNCLVRNNRLIIGLSKSSWDKGIDAKMYLHYSDSDMLDDGVYTHELDIVFRESINIDNNRQVAGTVTSDVSATVIYEITGKAGRSAYEDVIAKGMFYGTFEEWIDTLRQPALDAQTDASNLMTEFQTAENLRDEAELERIRLEDIRKTNETERIRLEGIRKTNELERIRLEDLRIDAEADRNTAEIDRLSTEVIRIQKEDIRIVNELERISSENIRATQEGTRQSQEGNREAQEGIRQTTFNSSQSQRNDDFNTAQENRDTVFGTNETTRNNKEIERINAETIRLSFEETRVISENTRVLKENARETREGIRQTAFDAFQTQRNTDFNTAQADRTATFNTSEANREINETERIAAETIRKTNEIDRIATINGLTDTFDTKVDKTSIAQDFGNDPTKVISQKGVTDIIVEELGNSTKKVISQKGITDKLNAILNTNSDQDFYAYGVKWDTTDATSTNATLTRIGNPHLHKTLPAHYWRKCLVKDDKTINYYLDDNNSNLNENGSPAVLDGSQGQIMSEVKFYFKTYKEGNWMFNWMSTQPLKGYTLYHNFIGSEEASIERATGKIFSCVNNTAEFRGGNNQTAYDNTGADVRGCAVTVKTIADFRTGGRLNRDVSWNGNTSERQRFGLLIAFRVAFATHNSQLPFNPNRTIEGYLQGGLGVGVTNLDNTKWANYNGRYPFIPNGYANEFGIKCGVKNFIMPYLYDADLNKYKGVYDNGTIYQIGDFVSNKEDAFKGSGDGTLYKCILTSIAGVDLTNTAYFTQVVRTTTYPFSFFGIRDIFGHIWEGLSDVILKNDSVLNTSKVYIFKDPSKIVGSINSDTTFLCDFPTSNGYIKDFNISSYLPLTIGGGTTTYGCDYVYTDISQVERGFFVGGYAANASVAGFAYVCSYYSVASPHAHVGGRLCLQIDNNTIIK